MVLLFIYLFVAHFNTLPEFHLESSLHLEFIVMALGHFTVGTWF